jgi:hypothetical protein
MDRTPTTYVVPCGAAKATAPTQARDLYTSAHFRYVLDAALSLAAWDTAHGAPARVLIMSARYGLVELDQVLAPYDTTIRDKDAVVAEVLAAQAAALGIEWRDEVYCLLPSAYYARLSTALQSLDVYPQDIYEGATGGIGDQRHVCALVAA